MPKPRWKKTQLDLSQLILVWSDMAQGVSDSEIASRQYPRSEGDTKKKNDPTFTVSRRSIPRVRQELLALPLEIVATLPDIIQVYRKALLDKNTGVETSETDELHTLAQKELLKHISDIRALAKRLTSELHLAPIEHLFVENFGAPGIHRIHKNHRRVLIVLEVVSNDEIQLLSPVDVDTSVEHLLGDLHLHLLRSEYSELLKSIEQRRHEGGEITKFCQQLLSKITNDLQDNAGVKIGDQKNGWGKIYPRFAETIGANAIRLARGSLPSLKLEYSRENVLQKLYSFYSANLRVADLYENELNRYEKIHRQMSTKYSRRAITKNIIKLIEELEEIDNDIAKGLERFTRAIPLPGYCDVCEKAQGLLLSLEDSV